MLCQQVLAKSLRPIQLCLLLSTLHCCDWHSRRSRILTYAKGSDRTINTTLDYLQIFTEKHDGLCTWFVTALSFLGKGGFNLLNQQEPRWRFYRASNSRSFRNFFLLTPKNYSAWLKLGNLKRLTRTWHFNHWHQSSRGKISYRYAYFVWRYSRRWCCA